MRSRLSGLLRWIMAYPLFALAILVFVGTVSGAAWFVSDNFMRPKRYVVVEFYQLGAQRAVNGMAVSIERVTSRPAYEVRLSSWLREKDDAKLIIDGRITNNTARPIAAFLTLEPRQAQVVLSGKEGQILEARAHILGMQPCPLESATAAFVEPGGGQRFSILLPSSRGDKGEWVQKSVEGGLLPRLSLGEFALGNCSPEAGAAPSEMWRVDFEAITLSGPELRDYFPFGAPTSQEIGINGRRYWTSWLPNP